MGQSGSLEQRVRRLEYEASAQRWELDDLRRRIGGSSGGETVEPGQPIRGGGFAAFETLPGAVVGGGRGGETPDEAGAAVESRGGERRKAEPMGAGGRAEFAQEAGTSGAGEGERWGARLRLDFVGVRGWEWWLNKVGIALLLFGVAFLFKFSWDRGWLQVLLTPWVRVGLGTALGCALILFGLRIGERRSFAAVLLGGGIGTLYIASFAAYGVLDLIPHAAAFAAMVVVTALAFALSVRQDEPVLSLVATVGGFATPFVLHTEDGSVAGLVLYTSVLLGGTAAIYLLKGWRSLLAVSSVGTWAVLYAAVVQGDPPTVVADATGWALQSGVVFAWLTLWLVPAAREVLRERDPGAWSLPEPGPLARAFGVGGAGSSAGLASALSIGTPLLALVFTGKIWALDEQALGYVALAGAGVYASVALLLRTIEIERDVSYVCGLVAVVLATIGIVAIFEGDTLFAALALEAAALHFVARRFSDRIVSWASRALYGFVFLWLAYRLIAGIFERVLWLPGGRADVLGVDAFLDLAVIALLPLLAHFERRTISAEAYRFLACGALPFWMARELLTFGDGVSYVVLAWTLYAVAVFVLARRFESVALGVATQVQLVTLGALVLGRLLYALAVGPEGTAVFNLGGITDLLAILVIGGYSLVLARLVPVVVYRLVAHAMLLTWFWGQLSSLPSGDAYVTIAWGLSGAALLVVGLRVPAADVVRIGLGTLFLVVAKLFLWDLAGVEAIWRVLLFLGFGGLFLVLSYLLPALWRGGNNQGDVSGTRRA